MSQPSQILTMSRPQFLDAMGAAHTPLKVAGQIARCSDEDALRMFVASHPVRRVQGWAEEMGVVADWLEQSAAAVREARERLVVVLNGPDTNLKRFKS